MSASPENGILRPPEDVDVGQARRTIVALERLGAGLQATEIALERFAGHIRSAPEVVAAARSTSTKPVGRSFVAQDRRRGGQE